MSVNPARRRREADAAAAPRRTGRLDRRAIRRLRMPATDGRPLDYPTSLLRYPSAAMFLLVRETLRIGQRRIEGATTTAEQMRFPHFATLACLDEFGPASQREIAERLRFDPSDLVGFVDWLEAAGFVERRRDEGDRRRYAVELTAAGRRAMRERAKVAERTNAELFSALTLPEREQLRELLLRSLGELERAGREPPL